MDQASLNNIDANKTTDAFLKHYRDNQQAAKSSEFDELYNDALKEQDKNNASTKPVNADPQTQVSQDTTKRTESKSAITNEQSSSDKADSSEQDMLVSDDLKRVSQFVATQVQFNLNAVTMPSPLRAIVQDIAQTLQTNPIDGSYELQSDEANIKFERNQDNQIKITLTVLDDELRQLITKQMIDDVENHLRLLFKEDDIELVLVEESGSASLFSDQNDQGNNSQEQGQHDADSNETSSDA